MMTFAKILLGVDNRRNKQKGKKERPVTSTKTVSKKTQCTNNIISQQKKKDKNKIKKKDDIKRENRKDSKRKL